VLGCFGWTNRCPRQGLAESPNQAPPARGSQAQGRGRRSAGSTWCHGALVCVSWRNEEWLGGLALIFVLLRNGVWAALNTRWTVVSFEKKVPLYFQRKWRIPIIAPFQREHNFICCHDQLGKARGEGRGQRGAGVAQSRAVTELSRRLSPCGQSGVRGRALTAAHRRWLGGSQDVPTDFFSVAARRQSCATWIVPDVRSRRCSEQESEGLPCHAAAGPGGCPHACRRGTGCGGDVSRSLQSSLAPILLWVLPQFSSVLATREPRASGAGRAPCAVSVSRRRCPEAGKVPGFYTLLPLTPLGKALPSNCSALIDSFSLSALNYLQRWMAGLYFLIVLYLFTKYIQRSC